MTNLTTQEIGQIGEDKAQEFLEGKGYVTIERNWHKRWAEIDIVMLDQARDQVVFVEVKTLEDTREVKPFEAVDRDKIHKLKRSAGMFFAQNPELPAPARVDVVSVELDTGQIEHFESVDFERNI